MYIHVHKCIHTAGLGPITKFDYNYDFDYEKIDYNRYQVIIIIIDPNPDTQLRFSVSFLWLNHVATINQSGALNNTKL
jgi:hypothetical protein